MSAVPAAVPYQNELDALYARLDPPTDQPFNPSGEFDKEFLAARYIWKKGSYRCGITAYIIFFLMSPGFVQRAAVSKPARFGQLISFAKSFDFTDVFIKQVTASGRGGTYGRGLPDEKIRKLLRAIQKAHDVLDIPHIEMVHFGYRLMQQLENDIGDLPDAVKQYHLQYMSRVYRTMGIPFSSNRQLLENLCGVIEEQFTRFTPIAGQYGKRLLFLGLTVGVSCDKSNLSELLPPTIKPVFELHYQDFQPSFALRILGRILNIVVYPRRRFRNPQPNREEIAFVASAGG